MENKFALIVAGGKGSRMKSEVPKQFLPLNGRPVLMHTLEAFKKYDEKLQIILVLPESDIQRWQQLESQFNFNLKYQIARGGKSRFQSVKNGLSFIEGDGLVAIHDGVRPMVAPHLIGASYNIAAIHHSAVAAVRLKESIRIIDKDATHAMDRSRYRLIQTPQTFRVSLIKQAYEIEEDDTLTDDASVFEKAGHSISLFEGDYRNIKITTREDMILVEALQKLDTEFLS
ncbi:MAG: 2-C-methyl-D-erythritol 4-phosphate cytidylyltransferase [Cyclobacteriaceae bacterium]